MSEKYSHTRKYRFRRKSGILLCVLYLLIALGPLTPIAVHSKAVAHAVTGECAGDCSICGCSLEARAARTCCCAKKKQLSHNGPDAAEAGRITSRTVSSNPYETAAKRRCCLDGTAERIHVEHAADDENSVRTVAVLKCGCPCGSGKQLALNGVSFEIIPVSAPEYAAPYGEPTKLVAGISRMTSRHCEPPDPPPRLTFNS